MKTFVNDKEITLQYNDIIDCSKPYKSLYGLEDNANVDNIIPYYTPRLLKVVNDSKLLESLFFNFRNLQKHLYRCYSNY
jgi:hypothetical protein